MLLFGNKFLFAWIFAERCNKLGMRKRPGENEIKENVPAFLEEVSPSQSSYFYQLNCNCYSLSRWVYRMEYIFGDSLLAESMCVFVGETRFVSISKQPVDIAE